jgi:hypothetical protein
MEIDGMIKADLIKRTLSKGNVFLGEFKGIDHKKFFIIIGISCEKKSFCSVYINSNIPRHISSNQKLLNLQVNIKGSKYNFLMHDSFVSCNSPLQYNVNDLTEWVEKGICEYIGDINKEDLNDITTTVINSGLLTENEIKFYFSEVINH